MTEQSLPWFLSPERSHADWAPLYAELIPGSGERLTVGVIVRSERRLTVEVNPKLGLLSGILGKDVGREWKKILTDSLQHWKRRFEKKDIDEFVFPSELGSYWVGEARKADGRNWDDMLALIWDMASCLAQTWEQSGPQQEEENLIRLRTSKFVGRVKSLTLQQIPDFEEFFNKELILQKGGQERRPMFHFAGNRSVGTFFAIGALPKSWRRGGELQRHLQGMKGALLDLERCAQSYPERKPYALICRPKERLDSESEDFLQTFINDVKFSGVEDVPVTDDQQGVVAVCQREQREVA